MTSNVKLASLLDYEAHIQLSPLIQALRKRKRIVVIAGAGISSAAGNEVPTFEDIPTNKQIFNYNMYTNDNDTQRLNKAMCDMYHSVQTARPTQFHRILEAIAKEGRLQRLYTQNIDGLDTQIESLGTQIPLPLKKPWPTTIQLHGDVKTVHCNQGDHISMFDPASFAPVPPNQQLHVPLCSKCEIRGSRCPKLPVLKPRVWLYEQPDYPDEDAIFATKKEDMRKGNEPKVVIVVGTALKVTSAKDLVKEMCEAVHQRRDGIAVWINIKAPKQGLKECFDYVIEGDCQKVAMHLATWWLDVPLVLNDKNIQDLQQRCKSLFIAKSSQAALNRALDELDAESLSKIFGEKKSKILDITKGNSSLTSQDILPELPKCWRNDMSRRLSQVQQDSSITEIPRLKFRQNVEASLWRLKPGAWLNDEIMNAYLTLLASFESPINKIGNTYLIGSLTPQWLLRLIESGTYIIYIPYNHNNNHWCFAVVKTKNKKDDLRLEYYDSLGGKVPERLLAGIYKRFVDKEVIEVAPSNNPRQSNDSDCGLFVLLGIRLLATGRQHLNQTESNALIPSFRERVLAELLAGCLDPTETQYQEFLLAESNAEKLKQVPDKSGSPNNSDGIKVSVNSQPEKSRSLGINTSVPASGVSGQPKLFVSLTRSEYDGLKIDKSSPEYIASAFADEATMLRLLKEAVAIQRATQKQKQNRKSVENLGLAELWLIIRKERWAVKQRHVHYEFSRKFWAVMKEFGRGSDARGQVPKATTLRVMEKLGIDDRADWKYAMKWAKRASVWTEIVDLFEQDLEHPSVALLAISSRTSSVETLTLINRKALLDKIRSRLKEPGNGIIERLKAASSLYLAVVRNSLPVRELPIESDEDLPFAKKVILI